MSNFYRGEQNKKYTLDESVFEKIDTPEKAYWLGYIIADGGVEYKPSRKLVINIKESDSGHLGKFRDFIKGDIPVKIYGEYKSPRATVRICRRKIVSDLEKFGVCQNKSNSIRLPKIPKRYMPDCIRGIYDGDGCLHKDKKGQYRLSFYGGDSGLLRDISDYIAKNLQLKERKVMKTGDIKYSSHAIVYGGTQQASKILNHMKVNGDEPSLERKHTMEVI
uniref:Putative homing endonuclease n=1 Tax=viral metagenome TaxID=1070528 RepID=A0A6M3IQF5_9ZZZZ